MVEQKRTTRISSALAFLERLLKLVAFSAAWLLVLIASAWAVLLHLLASALSRVTKATLSLLVTAEAEAHRDVASALEELSGRRTASEAPTAGPRAAEGR